MTLITALTISAVAIYYSVAGLVAIFSGAAVPIMIMGGALEISKLVTTVWLHKFWNKTNWWLKSYLSTAVVILMIITSMGIFGFLSKAHIEQTSAVAESEAQVQKLNQEIARQEFIVERANNRIQDLETNGAGGQTNIQAQIDIEQSRIDTAYQRVQPLIDEQNEIINGLKELYQKELDNIDANLTQLQNYIDAGDIRKAQAMVGTKADGAYGSGTAAAFNEYKEKKRQERIEWLTKIEEVLASPTAISARQEIQRLRKAAKEEIDDSNRLINNYRNLLTKDDTNKVAELIDVERERIKEAAILIDSLTEEKYIIETTYRKLEAEVGPIKYLAEFLYGNTADKNFLEEAVRWVIVLIIIVFDPLAVLLLIASQYTMSYANVRFLRPKKKELDKPKKEFTEEKKQTITIKENIEEDVELVMDSNKLKTSETIEEPVIDKQQETEAQVNEVAEKKEDKLSSAGFRLTETELDELDKLDDWRKAKTKWKADNPREQIKTYKQWYLEGKIDELPWEKYLVDNNSNEQENKKKVSYITKVDQKQIKLDNQ